MRTALTGWSVSVQESSAPPGVVTTAGRLPPSAAVASQGDQRCGSEVFMGRWKRLPNTLSVPRTLTHATAVDTETAITMYHRTASLLELAVDQLAWPGSIFRL